MRSSPYLDEILGRPPADTTLLCPKCGGRHFLTHHERATPAVKWWRWTLIAPSPEHLRYTCATCDFSFTAPVGTYKAKGHQA